jgi:hypothetical protein
MPSAIVKTLYFDLDKLAWTLTAGGNALLQPLTIGQNDTIDFNVQFIKGGVAQTLTAPAWSAGIKILNGFSNAFVVQFGAPTGTPPTYTFTGTISSTELSAALLTGVQFALEFRDSTNGIVTLPALTLNIAASYTITGTTPTSANGTLNVAAGKTVTFPLSLTFPSAAGTNGQQLTLSNSTTGLLEWAASGSSGLTVGTTTITSGTTTRVLYDNAGVVGEYAISGTGSVAMTDSPTFTTVVNSAAIICPAIEIPHGSSGLDWVDATGNNAIILAPPSGAFGTNKTQTLQNATGTVALTSDITGGTLAGSFTTLAASGTATLAAVNATGNITSIAAATQDAIRLAGRAGGTSGYILTLSPTTLTASRTATFPDASITVARTDAAQTFTGVQTFSSAPVIPAGSITVPSIIFASDTSSTASGLWDGGASGRIGFITGGINRMSLAATAYNLASNITINFNSATNISGYNDTTLRRGGIGLLNICAGTASSDSTTTANAKVGMGCAVLTPTTVANLPASPAAGWVAAVNNADTPVVGSTVVGGASAFALVCYNGSAWKVVAI